MSELPKWKSKGKGRPKLPEDEKKTLVRFFIANKYIVKNKGLDTVITKCISVLSK